MSQNVQRAALQNVIDKLLSSGKIEKGSRIVNYTRFECSLGGNFSEEDMDQLINEALESEDFKIATVSAKLEYHSILKKYVGNLQSYWSIKRLCKLVVVLH